MSRFSAQILTALSVTFASSVQALTLTTATTSDNFDSYGAAGPAASNWSTTALTAAAATGPFAVGSGTITNTATFDTQLSLLAATDMATALAVVAANGTNAKGKYVNSNTVGIFTNPHLATQVTALSWSGIMGNLVVGGTDNLTGMSVVWDSAIDAVSAAGATADDGFVNGHRLYYSVGGAVGSFKPVANYFFASGSLVNASTLNNTANIVFDSPAAPGTSIYVVWADDNAATNADGGYAIDNVRFTGIAVPEPSLLGSLLVLGGISLGRRRR
jgi:hypothetical protein